MSIKRTVKALTETQEREAGEMLVKIFHLRKDREAPGRYLTLHGNKTPLGIYRTMKRYVEDAQMGMLSLE